MTTIRLSDRATLFLAPEGWCNILCTDETVDGDVYLTREETRELCKTLNTNIREAAMAAVESEKLP